MKITRLSAQKKDQSRVNIEVDGEFVTGLSLEEVLKQQLAVGKEVTEQMLSNWKEQDEHGKILGKVINFLSYRPRTTREVATRLKTYTQDPQIANFVMDYLSSHNLLDDHSFATWWVSSRKANHSIRVLRQELQYKGILPSAINQVLGETSDRDSLIALITKKQNRYPDRAKFYRYCLSKGYSYSLVDEVFKEIPDSC